MADPIRDALERLVSRLRETHDPDGGLPAWCDSYFAARAVLAAQPAATTDPDTDAVLRLAAIIREVDGSHSLGAAAMAEAILSHPAASAVFAAAPADGPAVPEEGSEPAADHFPDARKMVAPTPSLSELVQPSGGYQLGTGNEDGAQLVQGANGPEWWVPEFGCDPLDATLDAIRYCIAPYMREPVAGVDVPGPDGDYGGLTELCQAQGVAPELGVPLLQRAAKAWGRSVAPTPPADPDALAARPLLEAVARMGDCIGICTVGQIMALSNRAASWLNENPPGQPVAIEPRGCPTPGACSCVQPVAPTPPADGEAEWLADRLDDDGRHLVEVALARECNKTWGLARRVIRGAALLQQLPPEGLEAETYSHPASGALVIRELCDDESGSCWVVRNSRHVSPCTKFPTLSAAWAALQQARRQEESDD